jgi:hypothetical protein
MRWKISAGGVDVVLSRAPQLKNDNNSRQKADSGTGVPGAGK